MGIVRGAESEVLRMEGLKVVKIVNLDKKYKDSKGKERTSVNYYVVTPNNQFIAIRPAFSKGYTQLDTLAEVVKNGK